MTFKYLWSGVIAVAVSACAPVTILNTVTPSGTFTKTADIAYGDHARQTYDLYTPTTPLAKAPVLVFVHGGGWDSGHKDMYKFLAESFTRDGYTIATINYRLHPDSVFPDPITDTADATAAIAEQHPDRPLVLIGHSAGAYNVLMTALNTDYAKQAGMDPCSKVSGVISLAGPVGLIPLKKEPYITVFPDKFTGKDAVINNVNAPHPPLFLMNGGQDDTVWPDNAERLGEKISARGGDATVKIYPELDHIDPVKHLSRFFDEDVSLKADISDFIQTHSATQPNYCR